MRDRQRQLVAAARRVLGQFGLPADVRLTLLAAAHNHVLRVDHGGDRWVLRFQSRQRLPDDARALQLEWMQSIRNETAVHLPHPVRPLTGDWFVPQVDVAPDDDARRACVLLTWVDGERLAPPEN